MKRKWFVSVLIFASAVTVAAYGTPDKILDAHGQLHGTGYLKRLGLRPFPQIYYSPSDQELDTLPDTYDSRSDSGHNYVAPVKDQGQCGSCWDFSMTKTLESARLVAGIPYLDLSEQDALDNAGMYGCDGGDMDATYWVNHGLALESDCPYRAQDGDRCTAKAADKGLTWGFVGASGRAPTEDELRAAIYKYKVISITVAAGGSDWSHGGKMTGCHSTGINHMVNLVGYDCSAHAVETVLGIHVGLGAKKCVFYGRNSWGNSWGDSGDFYAVQGCNEMASTEDSALFITHETPVPPPGPGPTPAGLPHPTLPVEVFVGAGDELQLGTRAEDGTIYAWSTGDTGAMVYLTPPSDKLVELKATNAKGTTTVRTAVRVLPKASEKVYKFGE